MTHQYTRRDFARVTLAAPIASIRFGALQRPNGTPNSVIQGVHVGVITGSFQGIPADQIIPSMRSIGLSEVELQSNHAEALAGAPSVPGGSRLRPSGDGDALAEV